MKLVWHHTDNMGNTIYVTAINIHKKKLVHEILRKHFGKRKVLRYDAYGKPQIAKPDFISISHTKTHLAIIISKKNAGIDIENYREKILLISSKFLKPSELNEQTNVDKKIKYITLCWSAKEAIYKWHGTKKLDFKNNMVITPFVLKSKGTIKVLYTTKEFDKPLSLQYFLFENSVLVYCCE